MQAGHGGQENKIVLRFSAMDRFDGEIVGAAVYLQAVRKNSPDGDENKNK